MDPVTIGLTLGAASGLLSGWSAKSKTERENRAIHARQKLIEQERKMRRKMFRVTTFSEHYDAQEAGAARINQAMAQGFTGMASTTVALAGLDSFRRSKYLRKYSLQFQEAQTQAQLAMLEEQKLDPSKEFWSTFLSVGATEGLKGYVAAGGRFGKKPPSATGKTKMGPTV